MATLLQQKGVRRLQLTDRRKKIILRLIGHDVEAFVKRNCNEAHTFLLDDAVSALIAKLRRQDYGN